MSDTAACCEENGGKMANGDTGRGGEATQAQWAMLPEYLKQAIQLANEAVLQDDKLQLDAIDRSNDRHQLINEIIATMTPSPGGGTEFLPLNWLKQLAKKPPLMPGPVDMTPLLCCHGKLSPCPAAEYRAVSREACDLVYKAFGGGPRILGEDLCRPCVEEEAGRVRRQRQMSDDLKTLAVLNKELICQGDRAYWVGRRSLRSWTRLAKCEDMEPLEAAGSDSGADTAGQPAEAFNEDLLCPHGDLGTSESDRKLVSGSVWDMLSGYFPSCRAFPRDCAPCPTCMKSDLEEQEKRDCLRELVSAQKCRLKEVLERKDAGKAVGMAEGDEWTVVSQQFVTSWKKFVRSVLQGSSARDTAPATLLLDGLLCQQHGKLHLDPNTHPDRFFFLNAADGATLFEFYPSESPLKVKLAGGVLFPSLGVCEECSAARSQEAATQDLLDRYHHAKLYVCKVQSTAGLADEEEDSPDEDAMSKGSKKRKMMEKKEAKGRAGKGPEKAAEAVRRSSRARPKQNHVMFTVTKNTTLKDFKIMILRKMMVMPSDQHLSVDGVDLEDRQKELELSDEEATLFTLRVEPESVVHLLADEPSSDSEALQEDLLPRELEAGFKGTELGGR